MDASLINMLGQIYHPAECDQYFLHLIIALVNIQLGKHEPGVGLDYAWIPWGLTSRGKSGMTLVQNTDA